MRREHHIGAAVSRVMCQSQYHERGWGGNTFGRHEDYRLHRWPGKSPLLSTCFEYEYGFQVSDGSCGLGQTPWGEDCDRHGRNWIYLFHTFLKDADAGGTEIRSMLMKEASWDNRRLLTPAAGGVNNDRSPTPFRLETTFFSTRARPRDNS